MKILSLLLLSVLFSLPVHAQDSLYFKDLYGFEDSTGTTHLYYFEVERFEVIGDTVNYYWSDGYKLNVKIRRFNTYDGNNEVIHSFTSYHYSGIYTPITIIFDLQILNGDPSQVVLGGEGGDMERVSLLNFLNQDKWFGETFASIRQLYFKETTPDTVYINSPYVGTLALSSDFDPNALSSHDESDTSGFSLYEGVTLRGISPFQDEVFFTTGASSDSSSLWKGNIYTNTLVPVSSAPIFSEDFTKLLFDQDSVHIYAYHDNNHLYRHKAEVYRSDDFGNWNSWKNITDNFPHVPNLTDTNGDSVAIRNLHIHPDQSGFLYIYSPLTPTIYYSDDYAETIQHFENFEHSVQGVYHKPGTDSLYVLTIKDLFLIEGENQTIVDEVPLSADDTEIPNRPSSITLHQNYPNPFNPETTIRFDLSEAAAVKIDAYDVMGRHVARLLNERTSAGQHEVVFNAEELSSGVYFYRLVSGNESVTRSMMLVK